MDLVIDANILFAALIKQSKTIELLLNKKFQLFAPELFLDEFEKYKDAILTKTYRTEKEFKEIINDLKEIIDIVPNKETENYIEEAKNFCPDEGDIDYFALALKLKCPIWSNDKKLKEQDKIKIYSTEELNKEFRV